MLCLVVAQQGDRRGAIVCGWKCHFWSSSAVAAGLLQRRQAGVHRSRYLLQAAPPRNNFTWVGKAWWHLLLLCLMAGSWADGYPANLGDNRWAVHILHGSGRTPVWVWCDVGVQLWAPCLFPSKYSQHHHGSVTSVLFKTSSLSPVNSEGINVPHQSHWTIVLYSLLNVFGRHEPLCYCVLILLLFWG